MIKKTIKVKKKKVKSKMKKKAIKKITKKKVAKKPFKKGVVGRKKQIVIKKRRRKRKKKVVMEDIYKIINKVQMGSKSVTFIVTNLDADTIENVVRDSIARYRKVSMKTQTVFTLYPEEKERAFEILEIEQLDDEIVEEGQIFP